VSSVATTRSATQAFLADLQASTPPARFATTHGALITSLGTELRSLDDVDGAAASGDFAPFGSTTPTASDLALLHALQAAIDRLSSVIAAADEILYAH
jgi:hypothetical protein